MTEAATPIPTQLDLICQELREAKAAEDAARDKRIACEQSVIELVGLKEEGSTSEKTQFFKVTTTAKLTRALDASAFMAMRDRIPDGVSPVDFVPKLDLKKLRALEQANPGIYQLMTQCITTKPAKPAVKVELLAN